MRKQNRTKKSMITALKSKGIKVNAKNKKESIADTFNNNKKSISMGNRTSNFIFGSKKNTHAGNVCLLIASETVKSKADIRRVYTKKYTFKQTLERLNFENVITFTDKNRSKFELTDKGRSEIKMFESSVQDKSIEI